MAKRSATPTAKPAFWALPDVATQWLRAHGWTVARLRATRADQSIPAPSEPALYDLSDIASVEGVGSSVIVARILSWAAEKGIPAKPPAAGPPPTAN